MKCIKFEQQDQYVSDFVGLYHKLYNKKNNMQNDTEIRQLLLGQHALGRYFHLDKFCIYAKEEIVGRFIITTYPDDDTAYLGFFECIDDAETARFLFEKAEQFVMNKQYKRIIGPVDASFWIRYRLKTNKFDGLPYTGEPYNREYYLNLFLDNGYKVSEHYTSSIYKHIEEKWQDKKCVDRYQHFINQGYIITNPTIKDWDKTVEDLYTMITSLYRDFPIYKDIALKDFHKYFENYKLIINFDMVKMAYYKEKAVGFFISIPNYHNIVYHTNKLINILKILHIRKRPKEYVMLYMGVLQEHRGLGKAIVQSIIEELRRSKLPSIGALQRDGKITQNYVNELIEERYEYVLLGKEINYDNIS